VWVPPATRPWFRRATIAIEIVFVVLVVGNNLYELIPSWLERRAELAAKCDLCSAWWVTSESDGAGAAYLPSPFPGVVSELVIDSPSNGVLRDPAYKPSYVRIEINDAAKTLQIGQSSNKTLFAFTLPDPMHLILKPIGNKAGKAQTVEFVRTTPIGGYPLLHRGFHWVDEYPYQR
jgi:hypothetical protein